MFEQMTVDCAKEASLGKLKTDNKSTTKGLLPSFLEDWEGWILQRSMAYMRQL